MTYLLVTPLEKLTDTFALNQKVSVIGFDVKVINDKNREVRSLPDVVKKILRP
jgi:hypothetical protein